MPDHDRAQGINHEQEARSRIQNNDAGHWLTDPGQLRHWQGQLVNSCHAINDQLTQIQLELKLESEHSLRIFGHPAVALENGEI